MSPHSFTHGENHSLHDEKSLAIYARHYKRSILTDGRGIPIGIAVAGANINDHLLLEATILSIPIGRPQATEARPQNMALDKGYDYESARDVLDEYQYTPHVRSRGEEKVDLSTLPGYRARRWVVERAHSWFNRYRRILVRWEKKEKNYLALLQFVAGIVAFRAAWVSG